MPRLGLATLSLLPRAIYSITYEPLLRGIITIIERSAIRRHCYFSFHALMLVIKVRQPICLYGATWRHTNICYIFITIIYAICQRTIIIIILLRRYAILSHEATLFTLAIIESIYICRHTPPLIIFMLSHCFAMVMARHYAISLTLPGEDIYAIMPAERYATIIILLLRHCRFSLLLVMPRALSLFTCFTTWFTPTALTCHWLPMVYAAPLHVVTASTHGYTSQYYAANINNNWNKHALQHAAIYGLSTAIHARWRLMACALPLLAWATTRDAVTLNAIIINKLPLLSFHATLPSFPH